MTETKGPIRRIHCEIKGVSPLLMHAFPLVQPDGLANEKPEVQCEHHVYRNPDNKLLFVPGINMQRALISAAGYTKGKKGASLAKPVAACVSVTPERLDLGVKDYAVDSRAVVIAATKGRIVRHRARLDTWKLTMTIEYDNELVSEKQLRCIVDDAGSRVGILDFRPEKKGPYGRFMVTNWQEIE